MKPTTTPTTTGIPVETTFPAFVAPTRTSTLWDSTRVSWGQLLDWVEDPADHKECGNYVLGTFEGARRTKKSVRTRAALTLDADSPGEGFVEALGNLGFTALYHTTFRATPEAPRYRVIIPLDRAAEPFEYSMVAAVVISRVGLESFDQGSIQPERYMYRPSYSDRAAYDYGVVGEGFAPVADLLSAYSSEAVPEDLRPQVPRSKRDPFGLANPVGAFNRVYRDFDHLISVYDLPYTSAGPGRWHFDGAGGAAGMSLVSDGLVYSHHSHDPASGAARTAFDLVRLHQFAELDRQALPDTPINRLPSFDAMRSVAQSDEAVYRELVPQAVADFEEAVETVSAEKLPLLELDKQNNVRDTVSNWDKITAHDPLFDRIFYNEMSLATEIQGSMPWRDFDPAEPGFDMADRAALGLYLERKYGMKASRERLDAVISEQSHAHARNPLQELLESLEWDGTPRVDTCLPGVALTPYTRMVARRIMIAAVARILSPGCKADQTLVLYGSEGLGKSYWIDRMSLGFSASLGPIGSKDTLLTMQRSWIMTSDEGYALTKADSDRVKEFITRPVDVFRSPYDREAKAHPRHCVIWGTTNDREFLRRQEGNRRFLIVECAEAVDFDSITMEYVHQVWAEAVAAFKRGEPWHLSSEETALAREAREDFTEVDHREGVTRAYLSRLFPVDWDFRTVPERQMWLSTSDRDELSGKGVAPLGLTCAAQIWAEALGHRMSDQDRGEIRELGMILEGLEDWVRVPGRVEVPGYGPQVAYRRLSDDERDLL